MFLQEHNRNFDEVFLQEHFDDNNVRTNQHVEWIVEVASCLNIGNLPAGRQDGKNGRPRCIVLRRRRGFVGLEIRLAPSG